MRPSLPAALMLATTGLVASEARAEDTKAECIAAADQGQSLRDDGKYHRAREAFSTCAREACPKVIGRSCSQWLRQLDDATPTVVPGAKDDRGADLPSAHVTSDGAPLTEALDGKPLPIDPGAHVLRFEHAGLQPTEASVVLRAGEKNRVVSVTLHEAVGALPDTPPTPAPGESAHGSFFSPRSVTSLALVVGGAVAIGVGIDFFAQAGSEGSTADGLRQQIGSSSACTSTPAVGPCQQLGSAVDAHYRDQTVGAVLLAGGGALIAGAVVTWLAWPKAAASTETTGVRWIAPSVVAGGAGVGVSGSF